MGQGSSNRALSRFTEVNAPPDNTPLSEEYLNEVLASLEESLKNLYSRISNLHKAINNAKTNCYYPNVHKLTLDESAAIYIYTMEWPVNEESLYLIFNRDLRSKKRSQMQVWFPYLRLLTMALDKIHSIKIEVFRGLRADVSTDYSEGQEFVWGSATSCTRSINIAHNFFANSNEGGTMFRIAANNGKDIAAFSSLKLEEEVLLCPGTRFRVTKGPTSENIGGTKITVIHLKQI